MCADFYRKGVANWEGVVGLPNAFYMYAVYGLFLW